MNALPVAPQGIEDAAARMRYFDDVERLGFDIAYNAYVALPFEDIVGRYRDVYSEFVLEAHRRGLPACIQIESTLCAGDRVGIEEAQYDVSNSSVECGENGFFASFASDEWKSYLKELLAIFVRDYGYDYVVLGSPRYRVDIPGAKDRFHAKFVAQHPDMKYPERRQETTEYLLVQQEKADVVVSLFQDLAIHAKSVGAKKVGVMPWVFIPTSECTPEGSLNPGCDIGRLARIPEVDFLVSAMRPDIVEHDLMRTGDELQRSPALFHVELMAHALNKDLVALSNPTDDCAESGKPLVPLDFYRDTILASIAAMPCGFTRHWYGENQGKDEAHMEMLLDAARFASRLGRPKLPVAFVFSYSGTRHAEPFTYENVFSHYWALAKEMAFEARVPMLTFHAETLERDLEEHPEVQVLVFEDHFPLSVDQMMVIKRWWQSTERRAAVAFGSGIGLSSDVNTPGRQPSAQSFPGIMELIGLRQEEDLQIIATEPITLRDVSRVRRSAFLGEELPTNLTRIADVRRVFGSRANVLYEADREDARVPVVAEWRDRSTLAIFCGFGLSKETAGMASKAISYALKEVDAPTMMIDSCTDGVVWNINKNDYVVLANLSDKEGGAVGRPGRAYFWDCREQKFLPEGDPQITIAPHSFRVFRVVGRRSKFLDLVGASCLRELVDGAGRAEMEILASRKTTLVLRTSPKEIYVDGKASTISQEVINGIYYVTLLQCRPGERKISLRW